jgi:hypothetical protein
MSGGGVSEGGVSGGGVSEGGVSSARGSPRLPPRMNHRPGPSTSVATIANTIQNASPPRCVVAPGGAATTDEDEVGEIVGAGVTPADAVGDAETAALAEGETDADGLADTDADGVGVGVGVEVLVGVGVGVGFGADVTVKIAEAERGVPLSVKLARTVCAPTAV